MQICEILRNMMTEGDIERDKGLTDPEGIEAFENISYGEHGKWNLLDVYKPVGQSNLPVIFNVHGGGWVYGDKEVYRYYCMELAKEGFAVVNFTYRLTPDIKYPLHMQDVNAAMTWTKNNICDFGGDIDQLCIIGDSAGGEMAAMYVCALNNPVCREKLGISIPLVDIKAAVLNCSVCDIENGMRKVDGRITEEIQEELIEAILGENYGEAEILLGRPYEFITSDFPPSYIMTSNGDFLRYQQHLLTEAFDKHNVPYEYHEYGSENEILWHVFHCNIRTEAAKICNKNQCDFFKRILESER